MNSSNPNSPSHAKERRRTPMACTNCRARKLKCRPVESVDSAPCERCVRDGVYCEYRPVDPSSASNNQTSDYQDNDPIILHHVNPAPTQEFYPSYVVPNQGGYVPDNSAVTPGHQVLHPNSHYTTPPSQHSSPYHVQFQYNNNSGYPADQSSYQYSSQLVGQPQYAMQYPPAHSQGNGSFDNRGYSFNGYDQNVHGSNYYARE